MYDSVFFILSYVGDKSILFVCRLYLILFLFFLYGQMVGNIFELRLFLYLVYLFYKVVISSPFGMNIVTCGVLIVERMINMFGMGLIYIAIYIRFKY